MDALVKEFFPVTLLPNVQGGTFEISSIVPHQLFHLLDNPENVPRFMRKFKDNIPAFQDMCLHMTAGRLDYKPQIKNLYAFISNEPAYAHLRPVLVDAVFGNITLIKEAYTEQPVFDAPIDVEKYWEAFLVRRDSEGLPFFREASERKWPTSQSVPAVVLGPEIMLPQPVMY